MCLQNPTMSIIISVTPLPSGSHWASCITLWGSSRHTSECQPSWHRLLTMLATSLEGFINHLSGHFFPCLNFHQTNTLFCPPPGTASSHFLRASARGPLRRISQRQYREWSRSTLLCVPPRSPRCPASRCWERVCRRRVYRSLSSCTSFNTTLRRRTGHRLWSCGRRSEAQLSKKCGMWLDTVVEDSFG